MSYALTQLETIIENYLVSSPSSSSREILNADEDILKVIATEARKVQYEILDGVVQMAKEDSAKIYIQTHLSSLCAVLDSLRLQYNELIGTKGSVSQKRLDQLFNAGLELEKLIDYLRRRFEEFFSTELQVPFTRVQRERNDLGRFMKIFASKAEKGIDTLLIEIINSVITDQLDQGQITYRQLDYFQAMLRELLVNRSSPEDPIIHVHQVLTEFNFNSPVYIDYCTHALATNCPHALTTKFKNDSIEDKLERYSWYLKTIQQVPLRKDAALYPEFDSVAFQMTNWIQQETRHLEKMQAIASGAPTPGLPELPKLKVHTDVSVSVLAIMLRLAFDHGLVRNTTKTEFVRAVAQFFTTSGADSPSFDSLHSKFYNPEKAAVRKVIDIYSGFIKILNGWL